MATRGPHPATTRPRPQLPQARLVLGAAAAAVGLIVALHWIVLPGDHVSLDQKNRRAESVAALEAAARSGSPRDAPAARTTGTRTTAIGGVPSATESRHTTKPAPRTPGQPVGTSPATKPPGPPAAGAPPASGSDSPPATETPAGKGSSSSPQSPPPPPPPPPPPSPPGLPQIPQLPQLPQVPVPTVPDLPKPQVPSVPTPTVPSLPPLTKLP